MTICVGVLLVLGTYMPLQMSGGQNQRWSDTWPISCLRWPHQ